MLLLRWRLAVAVEFPRNGTGRTRGCSSGRERDDFRPSVRASVQLNVTGEMSYGYRRSCERSECKSRMFCQMNIIIVLVRVNCRLGQ
jgi:hypothetical protein